MQDVPIVDIGAFETGNLATRAAIAAEVVRAVEEIGFLTVTGHGVSDRTIEDMRCGGWELFGLPQDQKFAFLDRSMNLNRGYTPFGEEHNGSSGGERAPPDLREGFIYGPFDRPDEPYYTASMAGYAFQPNIWPDTVPWLTEKFKAYYTAVEGFDVRLLRIFAAALGLETHFFRDKFDRHASVIRLLHYPVTGTAPLPGQLRCGAHTDFGSHTILLADDTPGGLQVRTKDGAWIDVFPAANAFIVNIGDLMMRWTNDRWLSNLHRVVNPPAAATRPVRRLSIAYFVHPNPDALIECIESCRTDGTPTRYAPVLAGDYRRMQVTKTTAAAQ